MTPATKKELWRLGIASYAAVASQARIPWYPYDWLRYLAGEVLTEILKKNARVIINAPPRHGKSEFLSHWVPTWYLDHNPASRVILTSYGGDFASDFGRKVRDEFVMNPLCWTKLRQDSKAVSSWMTKKEGGMFTTGVGGPITGKGADLILIDDPHKNWEEAMSPVARNRVIEWFNSTLYTRLEPDASILVIQTRWHEDDLSGYLLNHHRDNWKLIRFPALAEEDDALGRAEGDPLCPERYSKQKLLQLQENLGSYVFAGLYQQRPAPQGGGMLKKEWFRYFRELPEDPDEWIQTWDLTFKATGTSYVSGNVWCRKGANYYKVDRIKEKLEFVDQVRKISIMTKRWPQASRIIIEDAADAQAVKSTLKDKIPGIVLVPAKGSKEARLANVSGMIESGNVYLPEGAPWLDDFLYDATTFPNATNDDEVDTMTLALNHFQKNKVNSLDIELPNSGFRENPWSSLNATRH
jgi:predicted phage terminase large subunit-like protein